MEVQIYTESYMGGYFIISLDTILYISRLAYHSEKIVIIENNYIHVNCEVATQPKRRRLFSSDSCLPPYYCIPVHSTLFLPNTSWTLEELVFFIWVPPLLQALLPSRVRDPSAG